MMSLCYGKLTEQTFTVDSRRLSHTKSYESDEIFIILRLPRVKFCYFGNVLYIRGEMSGEWIVHHVNLVIS